MERRKLLTVMGGGTVFVLAGCVGEDDEVEEQETNGEEEDEAEPEEEDDEPEPEDEEGEDEERSDADTLLTIGNTNELEALPFDATIVEEFSGSGNAVTDEIDLESGLSLLVYESENVEGDGIAADIEQVDGDDGLTLAINETVHPDDDPDTITGASTVETAGGEYLLDIDTDGEWVVHVAQPRAPNEEIRTLPVSASGEDSGVVGPVEANGGMTVIGEHYSEEELYSFDVRAVSEDAEEPLDGEYAFTEDQGFEGESRVDVDGIVWFYIRTRGEWELTLEE